MIWDVLTPRETQVANLLLRGMENKAIADELGIGVRTVKMMFNRIFVRAGLSHDPGVKRVKLAVMLYREKIYERSTRKVGSVVHDDRSGGIPNTVGD